MTSLSYLFLGYSIILLLRLQRKDVEAACQYPKFLYQSTNSDTGFSDRHGVRSHSRGHRTWITEAMYDGALSKTRSSLEIRAEQSQLSFWLSTAAQCTDVEGTSSLCSHRESKDKLTCMRDLGGGVFIVKTGDSGLDDYRCMRFVKRGPHIVQVWQGEYNADTSPLECRPEQLERQEWPWITERAEEWVPCPQELVGGYDFSMHNPSARQKICADVWRPSHLDIDCVLGEGMILTFPDRACSPFQAKPLEVKLQCQGSWVEEDYMFLLAGDVNKTARYIMRFPADGPGDGKTGGHEEENGQGQRGASKESMVQWYFSPVIPLASRRGYPSTTQGDVLHLELRMRQSNGGFCYDESPRCAKYSEQGKCSNSALHQYAKYCKFSCSMCGVLPSTQPECKFPREYQRDWILHEERRRERLSVQGGKLIFTPLGDSHLSMGEYICKNVHWDFENYKLLSYYNNGCRPRYTCIHFGQISDRTLNLQLSRSSTTDDRFELCHFENDPPPVGSHVRSHVPKVLWQSSRTYTRWCGLGGEVGVSVWSPLGGVPECRGTLSDWDNHVCRNTSHLRLTVQSSCQDITLRQPKEFKCAGYMIVEDGKSLLVTQDVEEPYSHTCWVIETQAERMGKRPWKKAFMLDRAQCGTGADLDRAEVFKSAQLIITADDKVSQPCGYDTLPDGGDSVLPPRGKGGPMHDQQYVTYGGSPSLHHHPWWVLLVVTSLRIAWCFRRLTL